MSPPGTAASSGAKRVGEGVRLNDSSSSTDDDDDNNNNTNRLADAAEETM